MADIPITQDGDISNALPDGQGAAPTEQPHAKTPPATLVPQTNLDSGSFLDEIVAASEKETADKNEDDAAAAEQKKIDDKKAADDAEAKRIADEAAKAAGTPAPDPAPVVPAKDAFDVVELPPHVKPKSVEAFTTLKVLARKEVADREAVIQQLTKEKQELEEKVKNVVPPETVAELDELRKWKKFADIEKAPEFAEFDQKISRNHEAIYAKLTEHGLTPEQKKQIQELGGLDKVDWDNILDKLPAVARRYVEARLLDADNLKEKKIEAVETAKKDADKFFGERKQKEDKATTEQTEIEKKTVDATLAQFAWAKDPVLPANATEDQKKAHAGHVAFLKETRGRVETMLKDRSPQTRAEGIVGTAAAYFFKSQLDGAIAKIATVEKAMAEKTAELDRIKKASGARQRPSSAPAGGKIVSGAENKIGVRGETALDALRAEHEATTE